MPEGNNFYALPYDAEDTMEGLAKKVPNNVEEYSESIGLCYSMEQPQTTVIKPLPVSK